MGVLKKKYIKKSKKKLSKKRKSKKRLTKQKGGSQTLNKGTYKKVGTMTKSDNKFSKSTETQVEYGPKSNVENVSNKIGSSLVPRNSNEILIRFKGNQCDDVLKVNKSNVK